MVVVLLDGPCDQLDDALPPSVEVWSPARLGISDEELDRRGAMFGPLGLSCSMKAPLLRRLVQGRGHPAVFFDADSWVLGDLTELFSACEDGVVLTPHITSPTSRASAGFELEETFIKFGVFNAGLVGAGPEDDEFLGWWEDRTSRRCVAALDQAVNFDQLWLSLVPGLFRHRVLRDPAYNLTWWALYHDDVDWVDDVPTIAGLPLIHAHFAGISFDTHGRPHIRDGEAARFPGLHARPGFSRLCEAYSSELRDLGPRHERVSPPYVQFADGRVLSDEERRVYREAVEWAEYSGGPEPLNPFTRSECTVAADQGSVS